MSFRNNWSKWWQGLVDPAGEKFRKVIEILRERYVEEMQQVERFKQYARQMHYPQYQQKLLQLAMEKEKHAKWIAEKIVSLGGKLPDVREPNPTDDNSWRSLQLALNDENRSADHLSEQLRRLGLEHSDITVIFQEMIQEQKAHRDEIREMLMRSDPFALSLA
jgi:rubrerythrin